MTRDVLSKLSLMASGTLFVIAVTSGISQGMAVLGLMLVSFGLGVVVSDYLK
jgi:hypothetical protein